MAELTVAEATPRTEAEINAEYTMLASQLGDLALKTRSFMQRSEADQIEILKKIEALSKEKDALDASKAPKA